jgi:hypothetical protein
MDATRAIHEIQSEAHRLASVRITGAIESCSWASLHGLAERLMELAERGMYHESLERARRIGVGGHSEPEPR